jgi:hypothetical protein
MATNPIDKLRMQQQDELSSALRSGKTGTGLLDDSDLNVGNAAKILPAALPAVLPNPNKQYITKPVLANNSRLLNLTSSSRKGQSMTIVMTAARVAGTNGFAGPMTGIIEFGNGATSTKIEFDIPIGPYVGNQVQVQLGDDPQDSGAVIQVPAGAVRVFARYDNTYLTPDVAGGIPFDNLAIALVAAPNVDTPAPVNVKAFANYFGRVFSKLYKTQYLYISTHGLTRQFNSTYIIPPFAKSVRVIRIPESAALTVTIGDNLPGFPVAGFMFEQQYSIPSGTCPRIPIEGTDCRINIQSASANPADTVAAVKLVYEIGF